MKNNRIFVLGAIVLGLLIGWYLMGRIKKVHLEKILTPNPKKTEEIIAKLSPFSQLNLETLVENYCRCVKGVMGKDSSLLYRSLNLNEEILNCLEYKISALSRDLDKELEEQYNLDEKEIKLYRTALIMNRMGEDCAESQKVVLNIIEKLAN